MPWRLVRSGPSAVNHHDSHMATATIRDLRTQFPRLKELIAREGEVIVTDHGRPAFVLRSYEAPRALDESNRGGR